MKIVNIIGGLGNQMFQYAFAEILKLKFPQENIYIDTQHFHGYKSHNGFEIYDIFKNARIKRASIPDILKVYYYIPNYNIYCNLRNRHLLPKRKTILLEEAGADLLNYPGNAYYRGYWQKYEYYKDHKDFLRKLYEFPEPSGVNAELAERMARTNSVGIHVRRGDYLNNPSLNVCDEDYFKRALALLREKGEKYTYFVFSNDKQWCEQFFSSVLPGEDVSFVDNNQGRMSYFDMYLMANCRSLIISNSTFSWWAAFLNENAGNVICPKTWTKSGDSSAIQSPDWIKI